MLLCGLTNKDLRRICRNQYEHPGSAIGYRPETCLGHVYIVLEPVGSARLTFDDDWYYEFMCFDVPKVVRSPGCDHGRDEESRNGRDIKNDILDDVIPTPDEFRGSLDKYRSAGRVIGTTGEVMCLIGPRGERGAAKGWPRAPHGPSPNWTRGRGGAPSFLLFPLSFLLLLVVQGKGGSNSYLE